MNYKLAVSAWLGSQKLTEQEKAQRLRALRPSLDALRNSYQATQCRSRTREAPQRPISSATSLRTFTKPRRSSGAPFPLLIFQAEMSFESVFSFLAQVLS